MDVTGRIKDISRDWTSGKLVVSFECDSIPSDLDELQTTDKLLSINVKIARKKRSLNANNYYWELIGKLASKVKRNAAELHNDFLRRHPVFTGWIADIPDTEEDAKAADNSMMFHVMPTSQVRTGRDGVNYRTYRVIKGSHEYDTKEMSILIDDLVDECKAQGIETLTPEELERMKQSWTNGHKNN